MAELMCKSCQKRVPLSDIRADKSGSGWVCISCYQHQHPEIYKPSSPIKPSLKPLPPKPLKMKYYCSECGYKFTREANYKGKCPYCNLYSVKEERDAESLIRDSIRDEFSISRHGINIID